MQIVITILTVLEKRVDDLIENFDKGRKLKKDQSEMKNSVTNKNTLERTNGRLEDAEE